MSVRRQPLALDEFPVFVGGCVDGRRSFRSTAHAHTSGPHLGWICLRSWRALLDVALMRHEVAHLRAGAGHTDAWRREVLTLGGTLSQTETTGDYHKRSRFPRRRRGAFAPHHPACPCGGGR